MKIVVLSVHTGGMGSLTRIKLMISNLSNFYGKENIEWINVIPFRLSNREVLRSKANYVAGINYVGIITWPILPKLYLLSIWALKKWMMIWMSLRYSKGKYVMWLEMTSSYEVFSSYLLKKQNVPLIVDVHGTIDEILLKPEKSSSLLINYAKAVLTEVSCLSRAAGFIAVSNRMVQIYKSRYYLKDIQSITIPTIPNYDFFKYSLDIRMEYRKKLSIEKNYVFVYSGGIFDWQCIEETLKLFDNIRNSKQFEGYNPLLMMFIWDNRFSLKKMTEKMDIAMDNIFVFSFDQKELGNYLQACDVGIVLRHNLTTNLVASPTKIAEYFSSGLPIITTDYIGDVSEMVKNNRDLGYIIDLDSCTDLGSLSLWCKHIGENKQKVVYECLQTVEKYYSTKNYNKIHDLLNNIINS